jgi:pre-mRNA-processing factor 6
MKSAVFERQQNQLSAALSTLSTAISKFPKFAKLYMVQGQIHQQQSNNTAARASYAAGIKACPKEPTLWILASRLEEADGKSIKARALLDKARQANPGNDLLWAEAAGVEERSGAGSVQAKATLSRGLQECPSSGLLWSMAVWAEPRASRKTKGVDALRKTKDSPLVVCTVARVLWADRVIERARDWFGRATATDPDLGDVWAWWLKFERQHGTEVRSIYSILAFHHVLIQFVILGTTRDCQDESDCGRPSSFTSMAIDSQGRCECGQIDKGDFGDGC